MASKPSKDKKEKDKKGKKHASLARSSGADTIGEGHHAGDDRSEASSSNDDRINKILPQHHNHSTSHLTTQPTASLPAEVCFIHLAFSVVA